MTLDDLRVFITMVEAGSLGAAAQQLGCTLAGRIFYDASSLGLGALSLAEREINRLRTGEAGRVWDRADAPFHR